MNLTSTLADCLREYSGCSGAMPSPSHDLYYQQVGGVESLGHLLWLTFWLVPLERVMASMARRYLSSYMFCTRECLLPSRKLYILGLYGYNMWLTVKVLL
jgi:hypothetical protein